MENMKMSDVFELPMVQGSIVLMSNDHRYVIEFDASDSNVGDQIEHVAHAINNHDRMVEEKAELKDLVTLISLNSSFQTNMPHEADMVDKLISRLNKEGKE